MNQDNTSAPCARPPDPHTITVPVIADRSTCRGYPVINTNKAFRPGVDVAHIGTVYDILYTRLPCDAHFAAHAAPPPLAPMGGEPHAVRLNYGILEPDQIQWIGGAVNMVLLVVDIDAPKVPGTKERITGQAREAWDADQRLRFGAVASAHPGLVRYRTSGGWRLLWRLAEPFALRSSVDARRWAAAYKAVLGELRGRFGVNADESCGNWNRLFRAPLVRRNGIDQVTAVEGDLCAGSWDMVPFTDLQSVRDVASTPADASLLEADRVLDDGTTSQAARAFCDGLSNAGKKREAVKGFAGWMNRRGYPLADTLAIGTAALELRSDEHGDVENIDNAHELMTWVYETGVTKGFDRMKNELGEQATADLERLIPERSTWDALQNALQTAPATANDVQPAAPGHVGTAAPVAMPKITDSGIAEAAAAANAHALKWCEDKRKWLRWDGRAWSTGDGKAAATQAVVTLSRRLQQQALSIEDHEVRKRVLGQAMAYEGAQKVAGALTMLSTLPHTRVAADALDADPHLLNCANGVLDLRTGQLQPHDPALLMTRCTGVDYVDGACSELWERYLDALTGGDFELRGYLQRAAGMSLWGYPIEKAFFFLWGVPDSGKSRFLEPSARRWAHTRRSRRSTRGCNVLRLGAIAVT